MPQVGDKIRVKREYGRRHTEYVEGTITRVWYPGEYSVNLPGSPFDILYRLRPRWY